MNHELAQELKDAGFPQNTKMFWCTDVGEKTYSKNCEPYMKASCGQHVAFPTLEELIEVCGRPIWIEGYNGDDFQWLAGRGKGMNTPLGRGSTPTEAVARLWLALNPKQA